MSGETVLHARAKEVFTRLADQPPEARSAELERLRSSDPSLHDEVFALLRADTDGFLDLPAAALVTLESDPALLGLPGEMLATYDVLQQIGQGGMGRVFEVRHRLLDEVRVAKVRLPGSIPTDEARARFAEEARVAAKVKHPNVARIHDFGVGSGGEGWIVLEKIEGEDLASLMRRDGPLEVETAVELGIQACRALAHLHREGFLHRDISPDNFMLTEDPEGRPLLKLLDLGLAKGTETAQRTAPGAFVGKLAYAAPERLDGSRDIDGRSDLYSLALVLTELLTGRLPIAASDQAAVIAAHLGNHILPFSVLDPSNRVPPNLRRVLDRALARSPEERYLDGDAFGAALSASLNESSEAASSHASRVVIDRATQMVQREVDGRGRLPGAGLAVITAVLAVAIGLGLRLDLLNAFDEELADRARRLTPPRPPTTPLLFLAVDDASLEADPRPLTEWHDSFGSLLSELLEKTKVRGVVVDMIWPEAWSRSEPIFRLLTGHSERLVLGAAADPRGHLLGPEVAGGLVTLQLGQKRAADLFAIVNLERAHSGVIRTARTSFRTEEGSVIPTLAGRASQLLDVEERNALPERVRIDYGIDHRVWPRLSWHQLGHRLEEDPSFFDGRLVILGADFTGSGDRAVSVPPARGLPEEIPGPVLQGLVVESLRRQPITIVRAWWISGCFALMFAVAFARDRKRHTKSAMWIGGGLLLTLTTLIALAPTLRLHVEAMSGLVAALSALALWQWARSKGGLA